MDPAELGLPDDFESNENSPISNDELLSQLAGKEIERLLAEVDDQLDAALGVEHQPDAAPALVLRKYPQAQHVSQQEAGLADVLEGIGRDDRHDENEDSRSFRVEREEQMDLLGTPVEVFERVTGVSARPGPVDLFPEFHHPTPVVLKPLEWVNAPFEGMSQAALGAIGKVAIVCFISAVTLLAYVVVITR